MLTFHGRDSPLTLKILQHARLSQTEVHCPCRSVLHAAAITLNLLHMSIRLHCLTSQSNFPSLRMVGTACCFLQKINPRYIAAHGMLVFLMPMRPIRLHCGFWIADGGQTATVHVQSYISAGSDLAQDLVQALYEEHVCD